MGQCRPFGIVFLLSGKSSAPNGLREVVSVRRVALSSKSDACHTIVFVKLGRWVAGIGLFEKDFGVDR